MTGDLGDVVLGIMSGTEPLALPSPSVGLLGVGLAAEPAGVAGVEFVPSPIPAPPVA